MTDERGVTGVTSVTGFGVTEPYARARETINGKQRHGRHGRHRSSCVTGVTRLAKTHGEYGRKSLPSWFLRTTRPRADRSKSGLSGRSNSGPSSRQSKSGCSVAGLNFEPSFCGEGR